MSITPTNSNFFNLSLSNKNERIRTKGTVSCTMKGVNSALNLYANENMPEAIPFINPATTINFIFSPYFSFFTFLSAINQVTGKQNRKAND